MEDFVLAIDSPAAAPAAAGGKGANLSELARAGFAVPAGFIVCTPAYRAFVRANELQERIVALAEVGSGTDFEEASAAIRRLIERATIPPAVASAIRSAYAAMCPQGEPPVALAVRSSATAEDLPGASFAGQQDTYLNVLGDEALLEAMRRCWASLWTARALAYRARQGIDPAALSLAVVVQALVPANAAGVLFSANPLTGARDEVVISAAWGLGEAVVSGQVTPDRIIAGKATGAIRQMETAEKAVMTASASTGTEERAVAVDRRRAQVLDASQVGRLTTLAGAVEASFGVPQDIEWCLAGDELWIVQSRPITTLPPEPVRWESPVPGAKWIKDLQTAEWATEPLSPLGGHHDLRCHDGRPPAPAPDAEVALVRADQRLALRSRRLPAGLVGDRRQELGRGRADTDRPCAPAGAQNLARPAGAPGLPGAGGSWQAVGRRAA
jgi:rifampicin phosphotransferase